MKNPCINPSNKPRIFCDIDKCNEKETINMEGFMNRYWNEYTADDFKECYEFSVTDSFIPSAQNFYKQMHLKKQREELLKIWTED